MSRTAKVFSGKKAFIPFITAGDPDLTVTERLIYAMEDAGADLIEIGLPFSDPVAEGIVIQKADERALASGTTTDRVFDMIRRARRNTGVPLAVMTYLNPVFAYGSERFFGCAAECGIDALIVPDMPYEEKNELQPFCSSYDIDLISFIAPTSRQRIAAIAAGAQGFLYCVSSLGVTGVRTCFSDKIKEMVALAKAANNIPCAVGFGISTPEQAKEIASFADGVISGSAVMKIIERYGAGCISPVADYVRSMKEAVLSVC
jgi:tryptophan synthase alpha chain